MGMDINIRAFVAITDEYRIHLELWRGCLELEMCPPDKLLDYFIKTIGDEPMDEDPGDLMPLEIEYKENPDGSVDIELASLPKGVTHLKIDFG